MSEMKKAPSTAVKALIVVVLVVAVGVVLFAKSAAKDGEAAVKTTDAATAASVKPSADPGAPAAAGTGKPKILELGSVTCIPCKMMAPILEELKTEYAGKLDVDFIDVWKDEAAGKKYGISLIPTQILFDASGKELFRHEGFFAKADILAKWKELGVELGEVAALPKIERWAPLQADARAKDSVCYMCEGSIDAKNAVQVQTEKGLVRLCSPHCYFIMYSCLTEDKTSFEEKVAVTDYATGASVAALKAVWLTGADGETGRPWVKAFENRASAEDEMRKSGGSIVSWKVMQSAELSHRCGFCDRSLYPQDAAEVLVDGVQSWGCCAHCAMGAAARTGKDIEVRQPDGLTGEMVVVKTMNGSVASLTPVTAVAWFGKKKDAEGKWVSAGCFHQGFFATADNLGKWLEKRPYETGEIITIQQSLADKMKLSPQQIQKACKIGECAPK